MLLGIPEAFLGMGLEFLRTPRTILRNVKTAPENVRAGNGNFRQLVGTTVTWIQKLFRNYANSEVFVLRAGLRSHCRIAPSHNMWV